MFIDNLSNEELFKSVENTARDFYWESLYGDGPKKASLALKATQFAARRCGDLSIRDNLIKLFCTLVIIRVDVGKSESRHLGLYERPQITFEEILSMNLSKVPWSDGSSDDSVDEEAGVDFYSYSSEEELLLNYLKDNSQEDSDCTNKLSDMDLQAKL